MPRRMIGLSASCRLIDPAREETHYWDDYPEHLIAIDIWIGEEEDLDRGLGTEMMTLALARCFSEPSVLAVLVDPIPTNLRVRCFYERLGFRFVENRACSGGDEAAVYRISRQEWRQHSGLRVSG